MVDYFSFDEVMGELEVSEEELRRMVSEGELRAFRSENKMKFRKEDVEVLQTGKESEPTIILPTDDEAAAPGGTDDISLDLDIEDTAADLAAEPEPAPAKPKGKPKPAPEPEPEPEMELDLEPEPEPAAADEPELDLDMEEPAAEPAVEAEEEEIPTLEAETPDDSGLDDLTLAEDDATIEEADETLVEDESDTASTTAPLAFADEGGGEEAEEETATGEVTEEGEFVDEEGAATAPRRGRSAAAVAAMEPPKAGILWTLFLTFGFFACIPMVMIFVDDFMLNSGVASQPGAVDKLYRMSGENLWSDAEWKTKMIDGVPAGTVGEAPDESDGVPRRTYDAYGTYTEPDAAKTTVGKSDSTGG